MATVDISRRAFIERSAAAGVVMLFGIRRGHVERDVATGSAATVLAPNQWIAIDETGTVALWAHKSEMGQGVRTALPAILAAELGADWAKVVVRHAEPGPSFPEMGTSGSGSVEDSWGMLRRAAATARTLLIRVASSTWNVAESECTTRNGFVRHVASGRALPFADLVRDAAKLPVPSEVALRPDGELSLLGSRLPRVDTPAIVAGRAVYGIDVRVPGMQYAVLARPPVPGATVQSLDENAARAIPGVSNVIRTPSGVAVLASNSWAAIRGR